MTKKYLCLFYWTTVIAFSQHQLPFASRNNAIELSIANSATVDAENVTVEVVNAPEWIRFTKIKSQIPILKTDEVSTAHFMFSIDKTAPVGKEQILQFIISSSSGEKWTKEIAIQVSAPEQFELYQNYPNPFNPSTTISYLLPVASIVSLKVFDIVGREVATLFDGNKEAGHHHQEWRALNVATGMYIYQLSYRNEKGKNEFHRKKMILSK